MNVTESTNAMNGKPDTQSLLTELADMLDCLPLAKWNAFEWTGDAIGHGLKRLQALQDTGLRMRGKIDGERQYPVVDRPLLNSLGGFSAVAYVLGITWNEAVYLLCPHEPFETPGDVAKRLRGFVAKRASKVSQS